MVIQSLWAWPMNDWFNLMKEKVFLAGAKQVRCVCLQLEGMKPD